MTCIRLLNLVKLAKRTQLVLRVHIGRDQGAY
jgi:hypothetical protein